MQYNFYDQTGYMCMRVMANDMCNQTNPNNVEYFDYSPFGEVLTKGEDKKPGKVGFIDKEQDEESSYFQLGVRQYDPAIANHYTHLLICRSCVTSLRADTET